MAVTLTTSNTLLGAIAPKGEAAKLAATFVTVLLGSLLLTVSAKISVPVWPVPVTLQTFAVALIAAGFGWRIGVATVALYLIEGLSGLPVFATGGGFGYMFRPSFGFLVGYLPMAYIIGRAADMGGSAKPIRLFLAMIVADAVCFAFGFAWLFVVATMIVRSGAELPAWLAGGDLVTAAFDGAIKPFIIWDILKMGLASLSVTGAWALLKARR